MALSHVSVKTNRNSYSYLGSQAFSLRARQPEVAAFRPEIKGGAGPWAKAQMDLQQWLFLLDNVALNPRLIRGRIRGIKRKPTNPILDFDKRMAWIADQIGWPTSWVAVYFASSVIAIQ